MKVLGGVASYATNVARYDSGCAVTFEMHKVPVGMVRSFSFRPTAGPAARNDARA